jgi:tetratricopeptide (TPR) repeat protein
VVVALVATATAQSTPKAAMYAQAGWRALSDGQMQAAVGAFSEAIASDPKAPRLHLGRALALFALGHDTESKASLDRALALDPNLTDARELLGRLQYREGDLTGAIRTFESLEAHRPSLSETLDRWRHEAALHGTMDLAIGSGVTVAFEGPEDAALAQLAVASVERAAARIGATLPHTPATPVTVILYTQEQFRDITRAPAWSAGSFDGKIRIPMRGALRGSAELDRVLAHEYVHALVHDLAGRRVPAWLNEGLAVVFERENSPTRPSGVVALAALDQSFRQPADAPRRAYQVSAFAVQRLIDRVGGFELTNFLRDLRDDTDFPAAFERRFHVSLNDFEASLAEPE